MKKAADGYARATTSRTGVLDKLIFTHTNTMMIIQEDYNNLRF